MRVKLLPVAAAVYCACGAHPDAQAKTLNISYQMALPTGASFVSVVNNQNPLRIGQFTLTRVDTDLLGDVTVGLLSVQTVGQQISTDSRYDTELYMSGQVLPVSTQQTNYGLNSPLLNTMQAPVRYRFVQDGRTTPGPAFTDDCYSYTTHAECGNQPLRTWEASTQVLDTRINGLTTALFEWSGRPYTELNISSVIVNFQGSIDNYQITPHLIAMGGTGVQAGDSAYNAIDYTNAQVMDISGELWNQGAGRLTNAAQMTVKPGGSFSSSGTMINLGAITVQSQWQSIGPLSNDNAAVITVASGGLLNHSGPAFNNDGRLVVSGGGAMSLGATLNNGITGDIDLRGNSGWDNGAAFANEGRIRNSGMISVVGSNVQVANDGAGSFSNSGNISVLSGAQLTLVGSQFTNTGTIQVLNGGALVNAAQIVIDGGNLFVQGSSSRFSNANTVDLRSGSMIFDSTLTNAGIIKANGSMNLDAGLLNNGGALSIDAGGWVSISGANADGNALTNRGILNLQTSATNTAVGQPTLFITGVSHNYGEINVFQGSASVDGTLYNEGTMFIGHDGVVGKAAGAAFAYVQPAGIAGTTTTVNGELDATSAQFFGSGNVLNGSGVIKVVNGAYFGPQFNVRPGNSPGTLTIEGDAVFDHTNIEVQFGAHAHDMLVVRAGSDGNGGSAVFAGANVNLSFIEGAVPDLDDLTPWVSASAISGTDTLNSTITGLSNAWSAQFSAAADGSTAVAFADADAYQIHGMGPNNDVLGGLLVVAATDYAYNATTIYGTATAELRNQGRFYNRVGATLSNVEGGLISNAEAAFMQNRGVLVNTGSIVNAGSFINHADGTLLQGDGAATAPITNRAGGEMSNAGQWTIAAGATLTNAGHFVNTGTISNAGLIANTGGRFEVQASGSVTGLGTYQQSGGGTTVVDGTLTAGNVVLLDGRLEGSGTLQATGAPISVGTQSVQGLVLGTPTISPGGATVATLNVSAAMQSLDGQVASFEVDLAGNKASDHVFVGGTIALNAAITYRLVGGYVPQVGDSQLWLSSDGGTRTISSVNFVLVNADGSSVLLTAPSGAVLPLGDDSAYTSFTLNGQVETATWALTDSVVQLDFIDPVAVPEPASARLLAAGSGVLGALVALRRRRRQRKATA